MATEGVFVELNFIQEGVGKGRINSVVINLPFLRYETRGFIRLGGVVVEVFFLRRAQFYIGGRW